MRRRALLAGIIVSGLAMPAQADPSLEYAVKAAYLPKFLPFITWPDTAFASPTEPVRICVLGNNPFGSKLDEAAAGAHSGARSVLVRRLPAPDPEASCQVIFLSGDVALAEGTLDAMKGKPVVTVTDSGLKAHGVISFVIEANHVRFDIDDAAAAQDGLVISSKLLGLARDVKQRSQP
jgi:YfiR/HmsC-like